MNGEHQGVLIVLAALYVGGAAATLARLARARKHSVSIRMQIFLAMATSTMIFFAVFALILVVRTPAKFFMELGVVEAVWRLVPDIGILAFAMAAASAVAAVFIGRVVAGPLERLTRAAKRIAAGERQAALPTPRGREVRALTSAFESMRAELEERHALEAFIANLSHELKGPVATIKASSEVIEEAITDDPEAAIRFNAHIGESAERLDRLIKDLMTLAHLEAKGLPENRDELDLVEVANQAVAELTPRAAQRGIEVNVVSNGTVPVNGSETWLRRAIENLVVNAINHSAKDTSVEVSINLQDEAAELVVKDHGKGVDPKVKDKLFERFVTTRREKGGTGLGLSIVRAVAESHGGLAELRSTGPDGSAFVMVIPKS